MTPKMAASPAQLTEITSKSGTNNLHGSFFIQVTRPGLNAYQSWNGPQSVQAFDPVTGVKLTPAERGLLRDEDRYNQLGGSIGGPIWKNRVFAFFSYEGQSQTIPASSTQWFPTAVPYAVWRPQIASPPRISTSQAQLLLGP